MLNLPRASSVLQVVNVWADASIRRRAFGVGLAVVLLLGGVSAQAARAKYRALLFAGNYRGLGDTKQFDDNLNQSAIALRNAMMTWGNWNEANTRLMGNQSTATIFKNRITNTAKQLGAGDKMVVFYFGHGTLSAGNGGENSITDVDEGLYFPDGSKISDDEYTDVMSGVPNGVKVVTILINCWGGGFWRGDDPNDEGDLETLRNMGLMYAAKENQTVGGVGGDIARNWEPLYLKRLIYNAGVAQNQGRRSLSLRDWHEASKIISAGRAGRFEESHWEVGDYYAEAGLEYNDGIDTDTFFETVPTPGSLPAGAAALGLLAYRRR